jgi:hypothetical protein
MEGMLHAHGATISLGMVGCARCRNAIRDVTQVQQAARLDGLMLAST